VNAERKKSTSLNPLVWIRRFMKRIIIPGFDGLPMYDVTVFFFKGITRGSINNRASSLSFTFFLALFPTIIFFFTLIPYIPIHNFQDTLLQMMKDVFPEKAFTAAKSTLEDIIKRQHGGLLSVGFVLALYFATNGVNGVIEAFNSTYHSIETRSWIKQRLISIFLVIVISLLIVIAIALITSGSALLKYLHLHHYLRSYFVFLLMNIINWIVIFFTIFCAISFLYYYAPAKKERFRFISAGSSLATLLFVATSLGFNFYVNNFAKYNALYGSIGTLIVVLMWIYINALIILIGFELNASIKTAKKQHLLKK